MNRKFCLKYFTYNTDWYGSYADVDSLEELIELKDNLLKLRYVTKVIFIDENGKEIKSFN